MPRPAFCRTSYLVAALLLVLPGCASPPGGAAADGALAIDGAAGGDEGSGADARGPGPDGRSTGDRSVPPLDGDAPPIDGEPPPADGGPLPVGGAPDGATPDGAIPDGATPDGVSPAGADFPGHQPGKIYLGYGVDAASCAAGSTLAEEQARTGATRLGRYYEGNMTSTSAEVSRFESELAAGRLAWISFKENPYSWAQIAAGDADDVLAAKAAAYRGVSGPGLITFHHEPSGDGTPAEYVAAWQRILDVWQAAGGTGQITPTPILNGFFLGYPHSGRGYTDDEMAEWLPDSLIARFRVIGYDGYDAGSYGNIGIPLVKVVRRWREWLLRRQAVIADGQRRYLALGETGVFFGSDNPAVTSYLTSGDGDFPGGYPGWTTLWQYLVDTASGDGAHVAVNYFNSIVNTRAQCDWSLAARRPTTTAADQACDAGNEQPPPAAGVADASRAARFGESLTSPVVADVRDLP
jgi:hypothetical protein